MSRLTSYVVVDLEMTGLSARTDKIIEIGAVRVREGKVTDTFGTLVNPKMPIAERTTELTGITNQMVAEACDMDQAMEELLDFLGKDVIVGHNINFDYSFMKQWAVNHKRPLEANAVDTLKLARAILPEDQPKKLESLCSLFGITRKNAHRALDDALETYQVYENLCDLFEKEGRELPTSFPLTYHAKKQSPATPKQVERLKEYISRKGLEDTINWEVLTKSEASRIQDKYYAQYGR